MESKIALLMKIKQWKEDGMKRAPLVEFIELLIPCILHLENRVGEKIITMILQKGFDLWSEPKKKYLEHIEKIIQTKVLGTEVSPAHWSLPFEGKNDAELKISTISGRISGRNETVRTMISAADVIIEGAIPQNEEGISNKILLAVSHCTNCVK